MGFNNFRVSQLQGYPPPLPSHFSSVKKMIAGTSKMGALVVSELEREKGVWASRK